MALNAFEAAALHPDLDNHMQCLPYASGRSQLHPVSSWLIQYPCLAYHRLNDKTSITRVYLACREACMKQFALPPSKETEDVYYNLIK